MKTLNALLILVIALTFTSCSWMKMPDGFKIPGLSMFNKGESEEEPEEGEVKMSKLYKDFLEKEGYPKFYESFKDEELLALGNSTNTRLVVDLSDQRTQLYVNEMVALDVPCCTGREGKRTPARTYQIMEKLVKKQSNIYGTVYNGSKAVHRGDQRKYSGKRTKFVGTSLPYWMRLTGDGIGFHYSKSVKRYPASGGCIRMPMSSIQTIFSKVKRGTSVTVQP